MGQKGGEVMIQQNKRRSTFEVLQALQERRELLKDRTDLEIWMTPEEAGEIIGRVRFTVSEWCRFGKIHARKLRSGRGQISIAEIDGFLPDKNKYRHVR